MQRLYWRDDWHARKPKGPYDRQGSPGEAFLHHTADKHSTVVNLDHLAEQIAHMQGIQNYHMDSNGWNDIGYHWVVYQPWNNVPGSRAFRGRPPSAVPAAQLGHNTGTLAICVVSDNEPLKGDTEALILRLLSRYKHLRTLGGHRDVTSTSCPGDSIYHRIPTLAKRAGLQVYR